MTKVLVIDDEAPIRLLCRVNLEAEGMTVDRGDEPAAHARRALHWSRYARGPVNALHRRCAADITRGSLRLLDQAESGR